MKRNQFLKIMAACIAMLFFAAISVQAQTNAPQPRYKDVVVDNPTAEPDMKVVSDFVNALTAGNIDQAKGLMSAGFKGYGPSATDSATIQQLVATWQENYKMQSNRKTSFVTQTFKVLSGNLQGNWVSLWGDYTFTQSGKTITFPYQYTAMVADGKIVMSRIYYDVLSIATQLGSKLVPPDAAKK